MDFVHAFFDEMNPQSTWLSFFDGSIEIDFFSLFQWIEGRSGILNFDFSAALWDGADGNFYRSAPVAIPVVDDVHEDLFAGQFHFFDRLEIETAQLELVMDPNQHRIELG